MTGHITALFYDLDQAEGAVEVLESQGIALADMSLIVSDRTAIRHFSGAADSQARKAGGEKGHLAKIADGLVTAAAGNVAILATGPIMAALASRGTNAFIGGMSSGLCRLGIPARQAAFYEYEIRHHEAILLGVATGRHSPEGVQAYLEWWAGGLPGPSAGTRERSAHPL